MSIVIGVEFREAKLVLAAVERRLGQYRLCGYRELPVNGGGDWADRVDLLAAELRRGSWPRAPLVLALPAGEVFYHVETCRIDARPADLHKMAAMRFADYVPGPEDGLVIGQASHKSADAPLRVISAGAPRRRLAPLLDRCDAAGLGIVSVCTNAEALGLACRTLNDGSLAAATALMHWDGAQQLVLLLMQGAGLASVRSIAMAELAEAAGTSLSAHPVFQRARRELQRTLMADPQLVEPSCLLLAGGWGATSADSASEADGNVQRWAVSAGLRHELGPEEEAQLNAGGAAAVGAALVELEPPGAVVDFRQGEFRYRGLAERVQRPLLVGLAAASLLALFGLIGAVRERQELRAADRAVLTAQQGVWRQVFPERDPPTDMRRGIASELEKRRLRSARAARLSQDSALDWLRRLVGVLPAGDDVHYRFESLNLAQGRAWLQGQTDSFGVVDEIAGRLRQLPGMRVTPDYGRVVDSGPDAGKVRFTITLERLDTDAAR